MFLFHIDVIMENNETDLVEIGFFFFKLNSSGAELVN